MAKGDKDKNKTRKRKSIIEGHSSSNSDSSKIKCVLVGDGACGKTSLVQAYMGNTLKKDYIPTVFEDYIVDVNFGKKKLQLRIRDTAGQEDYDRLRPLSYDDVDVAVVCYDVQNSDSFENIEVRWFPELQHFCPEMPKVLVACKCDLMSRDSNFEDLKVESNEGVKISSEMGRQLCAAIGAVCFIECSAKTGFNIDELFAEVVEAICSSQESRQKVFRRLRLSENGKCSIL